MANEESHPTGRAKRIERNFRATGGRPRHKSPKNAPSRSYSGHNGQIYYGKFHVKATKQEIYGFRPNEPQYLKMDELLRNLRNPHPSQARLMELLDDMGRYNTSMFPQNRQIQNQLMGSLEAAVENQISVNGEVKYSTIKRKDHGVFREYRVAL